MSYHKIINTGEIVKDLIENHVKPGDIVLDCTVGNGNDTLFLSKMVGSEGKVYGFDIQKKAIKSTKELLTKENSIENVVLFNDSHENIHQYIDEKLTFIIYNLGYLPKGDKSIKTNSISTINSIKQALELLDYNGLLVVTVYVGHADGPEEKQALEGLFLTLDQKSFNVLKYDFINQSNNPPVLFCLEKSGKSNKSFN